ncbi:hypothetical protein H4R19_002617 [Coemansia spiralis]|nr:hypothetical protein H4R19_002617 [Coemansia spiralis]
MLDPTSPAAPVPADSRSKTTPPAEDEVEDEHLLSKDDEEMLAASVAKILRQPLKSKAPSAFLCRRCMATIGDEAEFHYHSSRCAGRSSAM